MISRIIKVTVSVISLRLRLITPTSALIIVDITKTSSNNCCLYNVYNVSLTSSNKMLARVSMYSHQITSDSNHIVSCTNDKVIPMVAPNSPENQINCETMGHVSFLCTLIND